MECDCNPADGVCDAAEVAERCDDSDDQDGDGVINDGCPQVGLSPEPQECINGLDDDGDTVVNDGCPQVGGHPDNDRDFIGDDCDNDDEIPDGAYVNDMVRRAICIGEADTDGDGWCDSTETLLGSCVSDPCPIADRCPSREPTRSDRANRQSYWVPPTVRSHIPPRRAPVPREPSCERPPR